MAKPPSDPISRFEKFIFKEPNSGCWLWTGCIGTTGYGKFGVFGASGPVKAHRFSYEAFIGPIPSGIHVCHKCDTRSCVRPDHLFLGTQKDNMQDALKKGKYKRLQERPELSSWLTMTPEQREKRVKNLARGEAHPNNKITESDVVAIRASKETQKFLAQKYGVAQGNICRIKNGKSWKHVP